MAKKLNQKLLNEELKKFKLLSEYTFHVEKTEKKDDDNDLILGSNIEEADEDPNAAPDEAPADDSKTAANQETDNEAGNEDSDNLFGTGDESGDEEMQDTEDTGMDDAGMEDTGEEEVDVDVTQLVKGSEEAKQSADDASQKTSELLAKFSELEKRVSAMDSITSKIDNLEKEIVKRNPTPVEKLEMRSMSSFPYNIKLTDYWKDIDGYDATGEQQPKEYVLTKDDVDGGYDPSIAKTFNVPDDYEEEDIEA